MNKLNQKMQSKRGTSTNPHSLTEKHKLNTPETEFINANFEYEKAFEFRDDEIKEAFNTIDIHKNGFLTSEELSLFLDILGICADEDEIREMIRMADPNAMGKVAYDEFREMAKGQLLSPIGLALPPTLHLLEGISG